MKSSDIKVKVEELKVKANTFMVKAKKNLRTQGKKLSQKFKNGYQSKRLSKDLKARTKAEKLAKLPKSRIRRIAYYLHPGRFFKFWFSKRGLILGLKISGIGIAVMVFVTISLFAYYRREIDADPKKLQASLLAQTTKFYDNTGKRVIYNLHGDTNRTWVELEDISETAQHATVAVEDKDFYSHGGFSITGVIRATFNNIFSRGDGPTQGGSTITQQFVKNAFLSTEKTITRKIKELILSLEMERLYTKDEILEFYLNQIPYGGTIYGIEAAAQGFFGKPASKLLLDESALLAALPQAPSALSPFGENVEGLTARQELILRLMVEQGYVTVEDAAAAIELDTLAKIIPLEERNQFKGLVAPHYVVEVQRQLEELFQDKEFILSGGLKVVTTLDYDLQVIANKAVKQNMKTVINPANGYGGGDNAALVSVDVTNGQVVAMVGSRDYNYPKFGAYNAALAMRQPGSSFKIFDYSALMVNTDRWGADSTIYDTDTTFGGSYHPYNWDRGYRGRMTVRTALGNSRNIPAVKAMYIAGIDETIDLAQAMGNTSFGHDRANLGLSAAIGGGEVKLAEHTQAYSTLARGGLYLPPVYILRVENSAGEVIYEWEEPEPERVLDEQVAYLITDILKDDAARSGTWGYNNPYMTVRGLTHTVKTGTTDNSVDGWMMGYTKYYATGVWAGNHDNKPMYSSTDLQTGPIWTQYMREAHADLKDGPIFAKRPAGVKVVTMDANTGYAASDSSTKTINGLFPSWYVIQTPPSGGVAYVIDKISGNLATECTPTLAKKNVKGSKLWPELLPGDPAFGAWSKSAGYSSSTSAPTATDDVHACTDAKPVVSIVVNDLGGGTYEAVASVVGGTHPLDKLEFSVDGSIKDSQNISADGNYNFVYDAGTGNGTVRFTAKVFDEVLYSSVDNEDVDTGTLTLSYEDLGGLEVKFNWTTISSADSYKLCITPGPGPQDCSTTVAAPQTSHTASGLLPGIEYSVFVQALLGVDQLAVSLPVVFTLAP